MQLSRRDFLKIAAATTAMSTAEFALLKTAVAGNGDPPVIWLQGQGCTGCSVSFLNSIYYATVDELLLNTISVEYHSTLMASAGDIAMSTSQAPRPTAAELSELAQQWLSTGDGLKFDLDKNKTVNMLDYSLLARRGYILVVEGAIPTGSSGIFCTVGDITMLEALRSFSAYADYILAIGTCASYGGLSAGAPNPTGAMGVKDALTYLGISKPVINIPGCPVHPDWLVGTISSILVNGRAPTLDASGRPTDYFGSSVHAHCPNLAAFNSNYAPEHNDTTNTGCMRSGCHSNTDTDVPNPRTLGMTGCQYALGCKGRITYSDCPTRKWNSPAKNTNGVNWCIAARTPCHGCTQPTFPDGMSPFYRLNNVT